MSRTLQVVDLFAGAGGESTGIMQAADERGLKVELHAVNHWERAIETHATNHPSANHYCTGVDCLDPCRVVPGGRVELLWASPECTHHSTARGGRPCSDQSRASAWLILKWCQELYVERLIVENVPEFLQWGPLGANGRPLESGKGATFGAWVAALRSLGYRVDWRVLNAADYGAPQTRRRLFVQAVRGRKRLVWPEATHSKDGGGGMLPGMDLRPWVAAREVIDWSRRGESIFGRPRPLAPNTLRRIEAGIARYWGEWAEPFLVVLRGTGTAREISRPLPAVTAGGGHLGLVQPFVCQSEHGCRVHGVDAPFPTVTASSRGFSVCEPLILHQMSPGRSRPVSEPLPAVTTSGAHALIVPYYGRSDAVPVDGPLGTVTCRDTFALLQGVPCCLDIRLRMLAPHELAAAQSFPGGYRFCGTQTEQVRQIGNAVPPVLARALAAVGMGAGR